MCVCCFLSIFAVMLMILGDSVDNNKKAQPAAINNTFLCDMLMKIKWE